MLHLDEGQKLLEQTLDLLVMSHRDRLGFGIRSARTRPSPAFWLRQLSSVTPVWADQIQQNGKPGSGEICKMRGVLEIDRPTRIHSRNAGSTGTM